MQPTLEQKARRHSAPAQNSRQAKRPAPTVLQRLHDNPATLRPGEILALQGSVGNRAVQRLLADAGVARRVPPVPVTSMAGSAPVVQCKRDAIYEDELDRDEGEIYDESKERGEKLEAKLSEWKAKRAKWISGEEARPGKLSKSERTSGRMNERGYKTSTELAGKGGTIKMKTGRGRNAPGGELATPYDNLYDPQSGLFTAANNFKNLDTDEELPEPMPNSEVIWHQFRTALKTEALNSSYPTLALGRRTFGPGQRKSSHDKVSTEGKLRSIRRDKVINKVTRDTIFWCDQGLEVMENRSEPVTVTPGSDDFSALLGTPNGNSAAWLLIQHGHEMGASDIKQITYSGSALIIDYAYDTPMGSPNSSPLPLTSGMANTSETPQGGTSNTDRVRMRRTFVI